MKDFAVRRALPLWFAAALALSAQAGEVLGLVTEQGRPVAGAEVVLSGADGVVVNRAVSDREGRFRLRAEPGEYRLGVFREEYAPVKRKGISVGDGETEVKIEITPAAFVEDTPPPSNDCN